MEDKRKGLIRALDSKRFVSLLILLAIFLLVVRFPEYTPHITTIGSLFGVAAFVLIGGYTLEQAVAAWRALPGNLADVIRAIVEEVLAAGGGVNVRVDAGAGVKPPASGDADTKPFEPGQVLTSDLLNKRP